ncbi:MAG: DUF3570 domain-containing protein, partial [Geothrix sp.]|nr:DUF3570 domain-containing protein [Geothrix sp.]
AGIGFLGGRVARAQSSVEMRYLFYSESDSRTRVSNPNLLLHEDLGEALGQIDLLLAHDSVSGASPTGAYPTLSVTTSTSASGISSTNAAGKIPMVQFRDERKAEGITYSRRFGAHLPSVDLSHSVEKDYIARGYGVSDAWTLFEGRGTLHYGLSWSDDTVAPVTTTLRFPKKERDYALGWTWVVGENDLLDVGTTRTNLKGDLDEPYLIVPAGSTTVAEHRPDTRVRDAYFIKQAHHFEWSGALKTSYRYYRDDWGIRAHTLDFTYDQHLDDSWILTPSLRFYTQSAATFYGAKFAAPQTYMSADYRLSAMDSIQLGCSMSVDLSETLSLNYGGTYQVQRGRDRLTPLQAAATTYAAAIYSGPSVSAADVNTTTLTLGLKWRF